MKRVLILGFLLCLTQITTAQGPLPAKVLAELKASTVFVRTSFDKKFESTGSGFLMHKDGETGLIVTNEHVISQPKDFPIKLNATVKVVFDSGRKTEVTYDAEVLAKDPSRDLAILRIKNAKDLPKPISLASKVEAVETMPVFILGFPFGKALAAKDNPNITIGKGSVSSIRENEYGDEQFVQIDGDINPGNSGGPIVTEKGELVGVTVAKITSTNIGFAIAPSQLEKMLNGRISKTSCGHTKATEKEVELTFSVEFIDPLNKIKDAKAYFRKADGKALPKYNTEKMTFDLISEPTVVDLKIEGNTAKGTVIIPNKDEEKFMPIVIQFGCTAGNDKHLVVSAQKFSVRFDPTVLVKNPVDPKKLIDPKDLPGDYPDIKPAVAKKAEVEPLHIKALELNAKEKKPEAVEEKGRTKFVEQIDLTAAISPFAQSPDFRFAYFVNRHTRKLQRVDMPKRKVDTVSVDLPKGCENVAVSEDGKTLFVNVTLGHDSYKGKNLGQIILIDAEKFTKTSTIDIPLDPFEMVEVNKKLYVTGGSNQFTQHMTVEYLKKDSFEVWGGPYELSHVRRSGTGNQVLTSSNGVSPGKLTCHLPTDKDNAKYRMYDSPYHGGIPLGGRFEVFSDAKFVIVSTGTVLSWSEKAESNLQYQFSIDPHYNALHDTKNKRIFTTGKSITEYSLPDMKPVGRYTLPRHALHAAIDPDSQTMVIATPALTPDSFVGGYSPRMRDPRNQASITLQFVDLKNITGK